VNYLDISDRANVVFFDSNTYVKKIIPKNQKAFIIFHEVNYEVVFAGIGSR
jgi:hypothetical protein